MSNSSLNNGNSNIYIKNLNSIGQHNRTYVETVYQTINKTNSVNLNKEYGIIQLIDTTTPHGTNYEFVCNNDKVKENDLINISLVNYTGSNGLPLIIIKNVYNSSFIISVSNIHQNTDLNGIIKCGFNIIHLNNTI